MYCYNCGKNNQDNDIFCYNCGTKLAHQVALKTDNEESKAKVRSVLQRHLKSPIVLIALILMTISVVLGYFVPEEVSYETAPGYEDQGDGFVVPVSYGNSAEAVSQTQSYDDVVFTVFELIDLNPIWIIAGLIIYFLAHTKKQEMKTGGLGMASVLGFINKIRCYIICGLILILAIGLSVEMAAEDTALTGVVGFMILSPFVGGICFLFIFWGHKLHKTMRSLGEIYKTGRPDHTISAFVGVMWFISGALLLVVVSLDYLSIISIGAYVASNILLGIQLFRLRGAMKLLAIEQKKYKTPVYAG